jgi:hypothetical protein
MIFQCPFEEARAVTDEFGERLYTRHILQRFPRDQINADFEIRHGEAFDQVAGDAHRIRQGTHAVARIDCRHHIREIAAYAAHPRTQSGLGEPDEGIEFGELAVRPDDNVLIEVTGGSRNATLLRIGWAAIELPRVLGC